MMTGVKVRHKNNPAALAARPAIIGLAAAVVISLVLCALFSFVFLIIKSVAESAILPFSLIAAGVGCFCGSYICAGQTKNRGVIYGMIIGISMFFFVWIAGLFFSGQYFGGYSMIKLIVLIAAGSAGGYIGANGKFARKKRYK